MKDFDTDNPKPTIKKFIELIDDLTIASSGDTQLKLGLQYLDEEAYKNGVSLYEQIYFTMQSALKDKSISN